MKKKYVVGATLFAAAGLWLAQAQAGLKGTWPLKVDMAGRTASGSIGTIRNATNNGTAYLGVSFAQVKGVGDLINESAVLFFKTPAGQSTYIAIEDPNLVEIAHTVTTDSYIEVEWDASFEAVSLLVEQSSPIAPKAL
jgi:hypothetical protein